MKAGVKETVTIIGSVIGILILFIIIAPVVFSAMGSITNKYISAFKELTTGMEQAVLLDTYDVTHWDFETGSKQEKFCYCGEDGKECKGDEEILDFDQFRGEKSPVYKKHIRKGKIILFFLLTKEIEGKIEESALTDKHFSDKSLTALQACDIGDTCMCYVQTQDACIGSTFVHSQLEVENYYDPQEALRLWEDITKTVDETFIDVILNDEKKPPEGKDITSKFNVRPAEIVECFSLKNFCNECDVDCDSIEDRDICINNDNKDFCDWIPDEDTTDPGDGLCSSTKNLGCFLTIVKDEKVYPIAAISSTAFVAPLLHLEHTGCTINIADYDMQGAGIKSDKPILDEICAFNNEGMSDKIGTQKECEDNGAAYPCILHYCKKIV
jgi:hypothetical protein